MTPAELLALADAATPGPWHAWREDEDWFLGTNVLALANFKEPGKEDAILAALAPDLARLCAEMGEALEELSVEGWFASWSDDPRVIAIRAALAKLSELESQ